MADKNLIVKIFSNDKSIETLKPEDGPPIIVITAGCPGVGKSTVAEKQFSNPGLVYRVSLDKLLESNKRFRNETLKLYRKLYDMKGEFTNENYGRFNTISRTAHDAKESNLRIPKKVANVYKHYSKRSRSRSPTRPSKNVTRIRSPNRNNRSIHKGDKTTHNLNGIREIGFEFGVANGLNILYDCTLHENNNKMDSIMKILQKYAEKGRPKYKIIVLLIEADKDVKIAATEIQTRIKRRHSQMLHQGFLRAIKPDIVDIERMIDTNRKGYDKAQKIYDFEEKNKIKISKEVNPPYSSEDFTFKPIINLHNVSLAANR